jgi:copper oxidase (laccase) domain-containing protein
MTEEAIALGAGAHALFTARAHGNVSSVSGEQHEQGAHARERLREQLGVERLVRGYQVHGAVVGRIHADPSEPGTQNGLHREGLLLQDRARSESGLQQSRVGAPSANPTPPHPNPALASPGQPSFRADGHAVAAPGIAAMVLVADCVPVVLGARGAVAALHAGWRGLEAGVLEEGMRALRDVGGEGLVTAVIGPCAGPCCYEVGEEVHAALGSFPAQRRPIDLRAVARRRLLTAGADRVEDLSVCTICDERYFSHRREGARAGRQAALAWLS